MSVQPKSRSDVLRFRFEYVPKFPPLWRALRFHQLGKRKKALRDITAGNEVEGIDKRYAVLKQILYGGKVDSSEVITCHTLDEAKNEVEEHLWPHEPDGADYHRVAGVYDLDNGVEETYEIVEEIRFHSDQQGES